MWLVYNTLKDRLWSIARCLHLAENVRQYKLYPLRHPLIQWGYLNSEKPAQRKAINENVMHKSEMITDAIYSSFKEGELKNKIASLGDNGGNDSGVSEEIIEKIANSTLAK